MSYAPLFNAMHGAKWLLSTRPIRLIPEGIASVNVFTKTNSNSNSTLPTLIVPIMLANSSAETVLKSDFN